MCGGETVVTNSIVWLNGPDQLYGADCNNVSYCDIEGGQCSEGVGNISEDPLFADAPGGDYHLKSEYGRWNPTAQNWVLDGMTSLCIDAGDPNADWTPELWPHGKLVNMGAYGGTSQAGMSASTAGNVADFDNDGSVNMRDIGMLGGAWRMLDMLLQEDTNRDGVIGYPDLAAVAQNWLWQE